MLVNICMKFHDDSLNGVQVTERTRLVTDRWTDIQGDIKIRARLFFMLVLHIEFQDPFSNHS